MDTINGIGLIISTIWIIVMLYYIALLAFKISYYERTFENNKKLFSKERYAHIEKVMKKKNLFKFFN